MCTQRKSETNETEIVFYRQDALRAMITLLWKYPIKNPFSLQNVLIKSAIALYNTVRGQAKYSFTFKVILTKYKIFRSNPKGLAWSNMRKGINKEVQFDI